MALDAGTITVAQAASEIRSSIERGAVLDPATFAQLSAALKPDTGDLELSLAMLRGASAGLFAVGGGLLATTGVGIGAAALLAGLGTITDGAISRFGPDALREFFPPVSDDAVLGVTAWAVKRMSDLAAQSPRLLQVAVDLNSSGHLPVNPNRDINEVVIKLPDSIRTIVSPHTNPNTTAPSAGDTSETVRSEVRGGVEKLNRKTDDYLKNSKERNAVVQAMKEAQEQKKAQYIAQEVVGAGIVGNFLLSNVFNLPDAGRKFQGFAQAGAAIYGALTTPGLGPLAIAGALANAATTIFGLFGNQQDPLLQMFTQLNQKLDLVLERLDLITQQQIEILRQLGQIYSAIAANQALLVTVQSQLASLAIGTVEGAVATERVIFDNSKAQLSTLLTNNSVELIAQDQNLRASYDARITDCFTFAHDTARSPNAAGNLTVPQTPEQMGETIKTRGRSDRLVGILPGLAGSLGLPLPAGAATAGAGPVSPTSWAEGVGAFLEGRTLAASLTFPAEANLVQQLWRDGAYLRDLIILLTSPEAIGAAGRRLRTAAGIPPDGQMLKVADVAQSNALVGEIYRTAFTFDRANVARNTVEQPAGAQGRYHQKNIQPTASVNFSIDYFQQLLNNNLLQREDCVPAGFFNPGWTNCFYRVSAQGPFQNRLLVPQKVTVGPTVLYPAASGNFPDTQVSAPSQLQEAAREIVLAHIFRPQVLRNMPTAIRTRLGQLASGEFGFWGEVVRFLGGLVHWRAALNDRRDDLLLANSSGPFSLLELGLAIDDWIQTHLSWSGDWPFEVAQSVDEILTTAIESLRAQAATVPANKSVPAIDETLRRLTGYMIAKGITVPT